MGWAEGEESEVLWMKILFISGYPPAKDGIGTYTQALVLGMAPVGVEARIVLPRAQNETHSHVLGTLSSQRDDFAALCKAVESWAPDIIHVQFAISAFGTRFLALRKFLKFLRMRLGVPVVITLHEVTREISLLGKLAKLIHRQLAADSDRIVVHTRAAYIALTDAVGVPGTKVEIIPHPEATPPGTVTSASELRAHFRLSEAELLVAFGFIHVDKGLDVLVQALRIINLENGQLLSNVRIIIAGEVRPRQGLFRVFELRDRLHLIRVLWMADRANVRNRIVLTGYVPEADVAGWFHAAAGIVLPYKKTEQSGVAALANSFRVPVLATSAGGLGEQYKGSQWLFQPRNPKALASAIVRFLNTPREERLAGSGARVTADLESIVKMTLHLYETVVWSMDRYPHERAAL